jgi:myo-inositol 2-dehydrogenase/D-chiro-inositol 1-dehydrogenase
VLVHCAHRNPRVPASFGSEMLVTDSLVHEIDTARWLLGQEIVSVSVRTPRSTSRAPAGVRDPQFTLFETEGGVLVDVEVFVNAQYGYDVRCELVGESGTLALAAPATVAVSSEGRAATDVPEGFQTRFELAYVRELQAWVDALQKGESTGASAWDGYAAAVVSEAGVESLASGRPVDVRMEGRPGLYAESREVVTPR